MKSEAQLAADYRAALDEWMDTSSAESADKLGEVENEVCEFLNIPLDETEQGLTPAAAATINSWLLTFSGS